MRDLRRPTQSLSIPASAYLFDHSVGGRSILPAVEALQYLARCVQRQRADLDVARSRKAEFVRFLPLPQDRQPIRAEVELDSGAAPACTARLLTRTRAGKSAISRYKVHVEAEYGAAGTAPLPPWDSLVALEGVCCSFDAERLYRDLVPFGPAFHNVRGTVHLAETGAVGHVWAAEHPAPADPLGNPFVLDAAFHLACAWGQRFRGQLTFPTGYAERLVERPCRSGEVYHCRVLPLPSMPALLRFDLFVFDARGQLCEACRGLKMQDVFQGRMRAADWVQAHRRDALRDLRLSCVGLAVVELDTLLPFYPQVYTESERARDREMSAKRSRSFAGARLALKQLSRRLSRDCTTPAERLHTVAADRNHPMLPLPDNSRVPFCAAAHDDRFAVAVGADHPVGVDVERLADRVLRVGKLYLSDAEQALVARSPLGEMAAALRVWTVKEAAAKALDVSLAQAFSRVRVVSIDAERCTAVVDGQQVQAGCVAVDDHVFTVLGLPHHTEGRRRASDQMGC